MTGFFTSIEFYVIATVVAAAIVAYIAKPSLRGEARQHFLSGELINSTNRDWSDNSDKTPKPEISLTTRDDGTVVITRHGISGVSESGAVSLAITIIGLDITIEERIVPGNPIDNPIDTATFTLDFLAPERYHLKYNSATTSSFIATTILARPGFNKTLTLSM